MARINDINHLALSTSDMKSTLQYYHELLGLPLIALYWMHGVDNTVHGFLGINDGAALAFVYSPEINSAVLAGKTHPKSMADTSTRGTMHHLAFHVDSEATLIELQNRLTEKGVETVRNDTEGFLSSISFAGHEGALLEISCPKPTPVEPAINEEAAAAVGISADELQRYMMPKEFVKPEKAIKNVPIGQDSGYRMNYPEDVYRMMVSAPDQWLFDATQDNIPPNQKQVKTFRKTLASLKIMGLMIFYKISGLWSKA